MKSRSAITILATLALLALVAIVAPVSARAGGGCHGPITEPGDGPAAVVKIDGCMFYPTVARVPVGTTVRFLNSGVAPHNVTGVIGTWASELLEPGAEFRQAFTEPGVYPFACTLHPGMNGAVVVGGQAVADADLAAAEPTTAAEPVSPSPDASLLIVVGLAALGAGLLLGSIATRSRRIAG